MLFTELDFALFFVAVFGIAWSCRDNSLRKAFLTVASWVFYGSWDWRFLPVLLFCISVTYLAARGVSAPGPRRGRILMSAVAMLIGNLAVFKYANFALETFYNVLPTERSGYWVVEAVVPLGLSFFTFQAVSCLIDVSRGRVRAPSLLDAAFLMSFFPHLLAGPIVRGSDMLPQLRSLPSLSQDQVRMALLLVCLGLFKKTVIATPMATQIADPCFNAVAECAGPRALLALYAYSAQIFCDFSGYSDIAIGVALLLGYRFPVNFDGPYAATSLSDFWRRWHISLSSWIRDYLFIPLGGSRDTRLRTGLNLLLVMSLAGLWHGASLNFVIWGACHGLALIIGHIATGPATGGVTLSMSSRLFRQVITFHVVSLLWVLFRLTEFEDSQVFLGNLVRWGSAEDPAIDTWALCLLPLGLALGCCGSVMVDRVSARLPRFGAMGAGLTIGLLLVVIQQIRSGYGAEPFIYFRF